LLKLLATSLKKDQFKVIVELIILLDIQKLVEKFKPVIYVPKESKEAQLVDVLCENFTKYSILWYHWPFDDYEKHEDYEPIILFFNNDILIAIGTRPHKRHEFYESWVAENGRPVIVFTTAWHGPNIPSGRIRDFLSNAFSSSLIAEKKIDYDLSKKSPPVWFVKDGTKTKIYDFADEVAKIVF